MSPKRLGGKQYPSDLSDLQWEIIRNAIPSARPGGRKRTTDTRSVVNAIFYLNRAGCAWRYLPRCYPPWRTVYGYFSHWKSSGILKQIHEQLVRCVRLKEGKKPLPSTLIIDSQSVRAPWGERRGYDGFKRLRGRKRHILVDTLGLIHSVKIHPANLQDRSEGHTLFHAYPEAKCATLERIYADRGYYGQFVERMDALYGIKPLIPPMRKNSGQGKPKTAAEKRANRKLRKNPRKRWIVERTFAWFGNYRRLSKDYERRIASSEGMIYLAMSQLMLKRLAAEARRKSLRNF